MTIQNDGTDPVAVLYGRVMGDLPTIQDLHRFDRLASVAFIDERSPKAKEFWNSFDRLLKTYRLAFDHFDESARLYSETMQQPEVEELIVRTKAEQHRPLYIEDAKIYIEKGRTLLLNLLQELEPFEGRQTSEAIQARVDHCQEIWSKYGFTFEEIQAIPGLIEKLRTEFGLISVDRKPTHKAIQKKARWTQLEKDVQKLRDQGKPTRQILNALRPQYPALTWEMVRSMCNRNSNRAKRGNQSK